MKFPSEKKCMTVIGDNRNMLIPWYLIASYAYYILDRPLVSDGTYDEICVMLNREWDGVDHMHKEWIDRNDLEAGTRLSTSYPSMAKAAACGLAGVRYVVPMGITGAVRSLERAVDSLTEAIRAH